MSIPASVMTGPNGAGGTRQASRTIIQLEGLEKTYVLGEENIVRALAGVDLQIQEGLFLAIMGPSGSGKSTMLNILGCLDRPTAGRYFLGGQDVARMDDDAPPTSAGVASGSSFNPTT